MAPRGRTPAERRAQPPHPTVPVRVRTTSRPSCVPTEASFRVPSGSSLCVVHARGWSRARHEGVSLGGELPDERLAGMKIDPFSRWNGFPGPGIRRRGAAARARGDVVPPRAVGSDARRCGDGPGRPRGRGRLDESFPRHACAVAASPDDVPCNALKARCERAVEEGFPGPRTSLRSSAPGPLPRPRPWPTRCAVAP